MKRVILDSYRQGTAISDEAFESIRQIVEANKLCESCRKFYSPENPNIALNLCTQCIESQHHLHFVGAADATIYGTSVYRLINSQGDIFLTSLSNQQVEHSVQASLDYWHFPMPTSYSNSQGEQNDFIGWNWRVYGNMTTQPALVIEACAAFGDYKHLAYLTVRNGEFKELNKRKGEIRKLFAEARQRAETTKDAIGYYRLPGGYRVESLHDADLYRLIADLVSEQVVESIDTALSLESPCGYIRWAAKRAIQHHCSTYATLIKKTDGETCQMESLDTPIYDDNETTRAEMVEAPEHAPEVKQPDYSRLYEALDQLPENLREIVARHYGLYGKPVESLYEMSRALSAKPGPKSCAAYLREYRALRKLRQLLGHKPDTVA